MRRAIFLWGFIAVAGACSRVDYVEIEPSQVSLQRRNEGIRLRAKPMARNGVYYPRLAIEWSCDDPKIVTVDSGGRLTATGPGHAICSAKAGGQVGTVDIDVQTVETVKVTPPTVSLSEDDDPFHPQVSVLDQRGHELKGRVIDMQSKDANVVNVDGEKIWPVGVGHTTVVIRADDRSSAIDVTVTKGKKKH